MVGRGVPHFAEHRFPAVQGIHQLPLDLLHGGFGHHCPVGGGGDGGVFAPEMILLQRQPALPEQFPAVLQINDLVDGARGAHTGAVGGVVEGVGYAQAQFPVAEDHHPHLVGIAASTGLGIVHRRQLEALTQGGHVQRLPVGGSIGGGIPVGQPPVADEAVLPHRLHQSGGVAGDGGILEHIAGVQPGHILQDVLGPLGVFCVEAVGIGALPGVFQHGDVLHQPSQIALADGDGAELAHFQIVVFKGIRVKGVAGADALVHIMGVVVAAAGDAQRGLCRAQETGGTGVQAFRHGGSLRAAAQRVDGQAFALKGLVLGEAGGPCFVHGDYAPAVENTLGIGVAHKVVAHIQAGHLLVEHAMVFGRVDGKTARSHIRTRLGHAHKGHGLDQLHGQKGHQGGKTARQLILAAGKHQAGACQQRGNIQSGIADHALRLAKHRQASFRSKKWEAYRS